MSFSDALGVNVYDTGTVNAFCNACAILALNGTANSGGSTTATDVAGKNIVALNTPLTTTNGLDVWNPAGSNLTNTLVRQSLYKGTTNGRTLNTFNQARIETDGSLFDLPAGPLKVAFGGEYVIYHLITDSSGSNGTAICERHPGADLPFPAQCVLRLCRSAYSGDLARHGHRPDPEGRYLDFRAL